MTKEQAEQLRRSWELHYSDYLFLQGTARKSPYSVLLIRKLDVQPYTGVRELLAAIPEDGLLREVYPQVWAAHIAAGFGDWLVNAFDLFSLTIEKRNLHEILESTG